MMMAAVIFYLLTRPAPLGAQITINKVRDTKANVDFSKPIRILVMGSDSRTLNLAGSRSDCIMLVQLNPDKTSNFISFPRDSLVSIPGRGENKINSAMALGGPELTVKTIEQYSGLKIDYYMVTTFDGLQLMVNGVGGVTVDVDMDLHDPYSGADLNKGPQLVNGGQALAFCRARHNTPNGDFTRAGHQQDLVVDSIKQEQQKVKNPGSIFEIMILVLRNIVTTVPNTEFYRLVKTAFSMDTTKADKTVLKGRTGMVGGASVVMLDKTFADQTFEKMRVKATEPALTNP